MALTESTSITNVSVNLENKTISVLWTTIIYRDGVEVSRSGNRRAFMESEKAEFLSIVDNAESYIPVLGWAQ